MKPLGKEMSNKIDVCQSMISGIKYNMSDIDFEAITSVDFANKNFKETKKLLDFLLMHLMGVLRDMELYRRVMGNKPPILWSAPSLNLFGS